MKATVLYLVRHSERLDEMTKGAEWTVEDESVEGMILPPQRWFDPLLSEGRGVEMARQTGVELSRLLDGNDLPSLLHSSPMLRTMHTAALLADGLPGNLGVQRVYGLGGES